MVATPANPANVNVNDLRAARMCAKSARPWFERQGLSWDTFVSDGYPVEVIEGTGDGLALKVAAITRKRIVDGQ